MGSLNWMETGMEEGVKGVHVSFSEHTSFLHVGTLVFKWPSKHFRTPVLIPLVCMSLVRDGCVSAAPMREASGRADGARSVPSVRYWGSRIESPSRVHWFLFAYGPGVTSALSGHPPQTRNKKNTHMCELQPVFLRLN